MQSGETGDLKKACWESHNSRAMIEYKQQQEVSAADYIDVLQRSGLAQRRPVSNPARIARMIANSNLLIVATDAGRIIGVARSVTDFAYCCYLSDLAVDRVYQGRGIGQRLIEETRRLAGEESMCLLVSAPDAISFYEKIAMPRAENAFCYPRLR